MRRQNSTGSELTFRWAEKSPSYWRLLPALLVCIAILGLIALIFTTQSPAPQRVQHLSQSILLLDADNPINQIVLNRAQDRGALILGTEAIETLSADTSLLPVFRPSFSGFQLQLKEIDVNRPSIDQPRLFKPSDLALPARPSPPPVTLPDAASTRAGAKNWVLRTEFHDSLTRRGLRIPPDFSSLRPQDLARLRFHLAVKPDGRPLFVVPLHSAPEDRALIPALQSALSAIRFESKPGSALDWGQVSFHWVSAPPKES